MSKVTNHQQTAQHSDIEAHLLSCDALFTPKLSSYVNIHAYSGKIASNAVTFEAWSQKNLIGLVAAYYNTSGEVFITNVSITKPFTGQGIARTLIMQCIKKAKEHSATSICLEVHPSNTSALLFYKKLGFTIKEQNSMTVNMSYNLEIAHG
ncbi:GNAT family N-acetyltransferase [Colwellia sp. D2M02]|uniref:GNAT family N-acetyltransferase n=1 Tax=Colwellia sp. D2M02 TaxID=2841562 RepID=UPI001C09F72F|nr:GNAT family N-acetyltransferase [Colwellia sp. D2M02]MBU2891934.1 GNAT family N-acetyltransferase [Colwellia sp. D2M02]